jgi:hypothetical protein
MGPLNVEVSQPLGASHQHTNLFFNRNVIKPVKGGGKGIPTSNTYETVAIKPVS